MGAYRCSQCNIHYVHSYEGKCPKCSSALWWYADATPDIEMEIEVALEKSPEATLLEDKPQNNLLVPNVDQPVTTYNGLDWIPHADLVTAGYTNLEPFDVVRIRNRFYELQSRVGRTLTTGITGGAWWIEEVHPEYEIEALFFDVAFFSVMDEHEYDDLERKRGAEPL